MILAENAAPWLHNQRIIVRFMITYEEYVKHSACDFRIPFACMCNKAGKMIYTSGKTAFRQF